MIDIAGYYKINVSAQKIILHLCSYKKVFYQELCISTRVYQIIILRPVWSFHRILALFEVFSFLGQCLSSLEIFDINAKASWSNFKIDRNPEFKSLKQSYKKKQFVFSSMTILLRSEFGRQACSSHHPIVIWICYWFSNSTKISTRISETPMPSKICLSPETFQLR